VSQLFIALVIVYLGFYAICVDKGFPRSGDLFDLFVGPISAKTLRGMAPNLRPAMIARSNVHTSLRQSAEWGMRGLQGTFSRLKTRLTSNKKKRGLLIASILYLHNFRTDLIGLNQIATVFNPEYEQYINVEGYDRIGRYFLNNDGFS
jgi:hypothetical protein